MDNSESKAGSGGKQSSDYESRGMSSENPKLTLPETLKSKARYLRENQTAAEGVLWELLRNRQLNGYKFRRLHPIREGIILDFYCHKARLAIELDGAYHKEKQQVISDQERTAILNEMGIRVIRFSNKEVFQDTFRVLNDIRRDLD